MDCSNNNYFPHIAKKEVLLVFLAGFVFRLLVSLQGADGVDVGFCNVFYQVIFTQPDSNVFNFIYYLTGIVGGTWELICGQYGLLGFRLLEALVLSGAIAMLYVTFRHWMPLRSSLIAIGISFIFPLLSVTFHYDTLSYLLITLSAFAFSRSLSGHQAWWLMVSGIMITLAIAARIVNATLLILLVIPFAYYLKQGEKRQAVYSSLWMFSGVLTGALLVLCLMLSLGHLEYYIAALGEAFGTFNSADATHSRGYLVWKFFHGYQNILLQAFPIFGIAYLWKLACQKLHGTTQTVAQSVLAIGFGVLAYTSPPYTTLMGFCFLVCFFGMYKSFLQEKEGAVVVFLLTAMFVFPFGSDIGAQGIFNWCVGLLVFPAVYSIGRCKNTWLQRGMFVAFASIALAALVRTSVKVYGDRGPRYKCIYMLQPERLNIFTEKERSVAAQHVIAQILRYTSENHLMLLINQQSELYYATRTIPFLGHTQPLVYLGSRMDERLNERLSHFGMYPTVVFLKQEHDTSETPDVKMAVEQWMSQHHYQVACDDDFCIIYVKQAGGVRDAVPDTKRRASQ